MEERVSQLEEQVQILQEELAKIKELQDDFAQKQIIRREVQFLGKVTNKNGTTVIN